MKQISPGKLWSLRRLADDDGLFRMTALDQRPPIMNPIKAKMGLEFAPDEDVAAVKRVIAKVMAEHSSALLLDPIWAYSAVIDLCSPRKGLILTLEDHRFEDTPGGRKSAAIPDWSVAKIRRIGGDAVKVLAWYRPDVEDEVRAHQERFVKEIGEACRRHDIPFVLELLVYPMEEAGHDYIEDAAKRPEMVIDSVRHFADPAFGVDLFKLESPIPAEQVPEPESAAAAKVQALFDALGEAAGRPWVMLSAGAGKAAFRRVLHYAYQAGASGFLAGRAIWWDAFQSFPDLDAMERNLLAEGTGYMADLATLTAERATPFTRHPGFAEGIAIEGSGFALPRHYGEPR